MEKLWTFLSQVNNFTFLRMLASLGHKFKLTGGLIQLFIYLFSFINNFTFLRMLASLGHKFKLTGGLIQLFIYLFSFILQEYNTFIHKKY